MKNSAGAACVFQDYCGQRILLTVVVFLSDASIPEVDARALLQGIKKKFADKEFLNKPIWVDGDSLLTQ